MSFTTRSIVLLLSLPLRLHFPSAAAHTQTQPSAQYVNERLGDATEKSADSPVMKGRAQFASLALPAVIHSCTAFATSGPACSACFVGSSATGLFGAASARGLKNVRRMSALSHISATSSLRSRARSTRVLSSSSARSASPVRGISSQLEGVRRKIADAVASKGDVEGNNGPGPRLVAVSKTKPVEALQECYDAGQRVFGENYAQELIEKAQAMPDDIRWHFIGNLQSNKAAALVKGVPNLAAVETVDKVKIADKLSKACQECSESRAYPLGVFIQVNTSGEESKSGVTAEEAPQLAQHVVTNCPGLAFRGLMTIGSPGDSSCFDALKACRTTVAEVLGMAPEAVELSMGMSGDFETAIMKGSTNVRVGSTIFGSRVYKTKTEEEPKPEEAIEEREGGA